MSHVTREWERGEAMELIAIGIAIEMDALEECEHCGEVTNQLAGEEDVLNEALQRFNAGAIQMKDFQDADEVRAVIQDILSNAEEECSCVRHDDD